MIWMFWFARPILRKGPPDKNLFCLISNLNDDPSQVRVGGESLVLEPGDGCWVPEGIELRPAGTAGKTRFGHSLENRETGMIQSVRRRLYLGD